MSISEQLFRWIGEDSQGEGLVPIHLLLVKQAMHARGEAADLTASTKLSLELFERSAVYRALKELYTQGLLEFIGSDGRPVVPTEQEIAKAGAGERVSFQVVRLTANGLDRYAVLPK